MVGSNQRELIKKGYGKAYILKIIYSKQRELDYSNYQVSTDGLIFINLM